MYNAYPSVAGTSLAASGTIAEEYIPLWIYSSGTGSSSNGTTNAYLGKGMTSFGTSINSNQKLHTLSVGWATGQKFALEVSFYTGSGYTAYAQLYDVTASSLVASSQISTTATTATLVRSGSFTLTGGHVYAVAIWNSSTGTIYLTKAHLVALEM